MLIPPPRENDLNQKGHSVHCSPVEIPLVRCSRNRGVSNYERTCTFTMQYLRTACPFNDFSNKLDTVPKNRRNRSFGRPIRSSAVRSLRQSSSAGLRRASVEGLAEKRRSAPSKILQRSSIPLIAKASGIDLFQGALRFVNQEVAEWALDDVTHLYSMLMLQFI